MKNKSKIVIMVVLFLAVCAVGGFFYTKLMPKAEEGEKSISIQVIHGDKSEKTFTYDTKAEYLGEVLNDNNLAEGEDGDYGMFIITVDKESADEAKQQWWCITKDGGQVDTSADQTVIKDGDSFELTLMEGYE